LHSRGEGSWKKVVGRMWHYRFLTAIKMMCTDKSFKAIPSGVFHFTVSNTTTSSRVP
jgi:hypothetical protein